jgi:hypothetical protein
MKQTSLFGFSGQQLSEIGQQMAIENANDKVPEWSELAFNFLKEYIKTHEKFLAEDCRYASDGIVPKSPSSRAWGGIIRRAAHEGLITRIGHDKVCNPYAHRCWATLWQRV